MMVCVEAGGNWSRLMLFMNVSPARSPPGGCHFSLMKSNQKSRHRGCFFCRTGLYPANQSAPQGHSFVAPRFRPTLRNNPDAFSCHTSFHMLLNFAHKLLRCRGKRREQIIPHLSIARDEAIANMQSYHAYSQLPRRTNAHNPTQAPYSNDKRKQ